MTAGSAAVGRAGRRLRKGAVAALESRPRWHRRVMRLEQWRLARRLDVLHRVRRRVPVIVFQMGKVGSTSVRASFPCPGYPLAVQVHHLHRPRIDAAMAWSTDRGLPTRAHYFHARAVADRVLERGRPFKAITLVREPVGRSVSNVFHNLDRPGTPAADPPAGPDMATIVALLTGPERARELDESRWYPQEFEPALGVDVYAHPFPHEQGWQVLPAGPGEVLVLRLETPDPVKEAAISAFLGVDGFTLSSANVGEAKGYGAWYRRFREEVVLPEEWLERKLGSRYATHFYSDAERDEIRARWGPRPGASRW